MITLTNLRETPNDYGGSELKKAVYIDGIRYMVKFPDPVRKRMRQKSISTMCFQKKLVVKFLGCWTFQRKKLFWQNTWSMIRKRLLLCVKIFARREVV